VGKGTTIERLEITQRRENFRAGNFVSGPEIPPQDKISGAALRNSAKSLMERCGATCSKGAGNFIISGPRKFS
jgi:hypothetical protein